MQGSRTRVWMAIGVLSSLVLVGGCSDDDDSATPSSTTTTSTTVAPETPPEGTTVDVSAVELLPVPEGDGVVASSAIDTGDPEVEPTLADDYEETEYLFRSVGATYEGPSTGPVEVASSGNEFTTRVIARFPADPADFSGRVFLEPFNTTAGPDRDVIWRRVAPLLQEQGDGWVGISVRSTSQTELQTFDPVRYADVDIPTNDTVWDMLRQLGAVLRLGGEQSPIPDFARHLYMGGYSQSGVDTATFAMAFHDDTELLDGGPIFDGYFPAAHSATRTPVQTGSGLVVEFDEGPMEAVDVPVLDFETQHDVQGWSREVVEGTFYTSPGAASVRRDDADTETDKYRLVEITGASHSEFGADCGGDPSTFPLARFIRAALAQLFTWAEDGEAPPEADRIEMEEIDTVSTAATDELGHALGGVRSPFVDAPLVRYDVFSDVTSLSCTFSGTEEPLSPDELAERYGDVDGYVDEFTESLDDTIEDGFLLESERSEMIDDATDRAEELFPAA